MCSQKKSNNMIPKQAIKLENIHDFMTKNSDKII